MRITQVRDDGKVNTLRTLRIEQLVELMKVETKAQPVSKMREVLPYMLPGDKNDYVQKVPKLLPAAAFVRKNGVKIPVINGTIPHKQEMRFGGSLVMVRPAAPGTGIIAGGAMRAVLESVGVKNVLAKSKGSSNPHNLVKATIAALCELRDAHSVAQLRGISMNQVFNG